MKWGVAHPPHGLEQPIRYIMFLSAIPAQKIRFSIFVLAAVISHGKLKKIKPAKEFLFFIRLNYNFREIIIKLF